MERFVLIFIIATCMWGVASARLRTGVFMTGGLMLVLCGCVAALDSEADLKHACSLRTYGTGLVAWSFAWRFALRGWWVRAAARWYLAASLARFAGIDDRRAGDRRLAHRRRA